MTINERIRKARQAIGLTQGKFAERMGISTSHLAGLELGDKTANERMIRLINAEFGVDEHWLRTGEGAMFSGDADARVAKLVSLFKSLTPAFQECVLKVVEGISDLNRQYTE